MKSRNRSAQIMFTRWAERHEPVARFEGRRPADVAAWKRETLPRVLACLGAMPPKVPPNPERLAEWTDEGVRKERWLIDVMPDFSTVVQINRPATLRRDARRPTLLCWHGHGVFGKEPVMGNKGNAAMQAEQKLFNNGYGLAMAQAGFVTYGVDWLGQGENREDAAPNWQNQAGGRDWCNLYYLHATMLGTTPLALNMAIARAATDFVLRQPGADARRLGVMGLSGGGTMTLWTALTDERFRAMEIICYSQRWPAFGFRDVNYCGNQTAPGLFHLVDLPDLQGLLVPRPLLVDIGLHDSCLRAEDALPCYRQVERIYRAAGARRNLELDLYPGEHAWGANKSLKFFRKHLR